jgi:ribonuclease-3
VGRGELLNRQKIRTSILADFFEAIIGALYLDAGIEVVKKLIYKNLLPEIRGKLQEPDSNWKAELQEMLQKSKQGMPTYSVLSETGPDHHKCFEVGVFLAKTLLGTGQGSSKKEAEQKAALSALTQLKEKQT